MPGPAAAALKRPGENIAVARVRRGETRRVGRSAWASPTRALGDRPFLREQRSAHSC